MSKEKEMKKRQQALPGTENILTERICVYGIVQGVGFRPFVSRIADRAGITGSVANRGSYVEIFACGTKEKLSRFAYDLEKNPPERAAVLKIERKKISGYAVPEAFSIIESEKEEGAIFVSPDIATCPKCRRELYDKTNRRYMHPFINCTACGPRLTILDSMPYDRERTSMGEFPMCPACAFEYTHAETRRYDAQPVCCNDCGPQVYLLEKIPAAAAGFAQKPDVSDSPATAAGTGRSPENSNSAASADTAGNAQEGASLTKGAGKARAVSAAVHMRRRTKTGPADTEEQPAGFIRTAVGRDAITAARRSINDGKIIAVKGIGGFHLCCDAKNEAAVSRLRRLKKRPMKPFAVMMPDIETVRRECNVGEKQEDILDGHQKPILLLPKKETGMLAPSVAPDNPNVGVMLPYAPVQMLLFSYNDDVVMKTDVFVMTSGNVSGAPICRTDEDAAAELGAFCDLILSHDRKIRLRADDSVMDFYRGEPYMIRRSRGYAPLPVMLSAQRWVGQVLAVGGELKNTFCIAKDDLFYLSPYVGDMEDIRTVRALEESIVRMEELLEAKPAVVSCDMHPKYNTTAVAESLGLPVYPVQHHYAHILSCMAENDFAGAVIGAAMDGTGYGTDGSIWGGEILLADYRGFRRVGSIRPFAQAGGDASAREGWRIAASMLYGLFGDEAEDMLQRLGVCEPKDARLVKMMVSRKINTVKSTSAGRLFDAAAAVLGIRRESTFEGEAANALQFAAEAYAARAETEGREPAQAAAQSMAQRAAQREAQCTALEETEAAFVRIRPEYPADRGKEAAENAERSMADQEEGLPGDEGVLNLDKVNDMPGHAETHYSGRTIPGHAETLDQENTLSESGGQFFLPTEKIIHLLAEQKLAGAEKGELAYAFHALFARQIAAGVREASRLSGLKVCALSGGVFQNRLLLALCEEELEKDGFHVLRHRLVPPNDGGIALGQAAAAMTALADGRI